jgi:hypothetical protein
MAKQACRIREVLAVSAILARPNFDVTKIGAKIGA